MANYFEPVLSEEQMAAYLDGMLSEVESGMVEELIASDPEMEEIIDTFDSVDTAMIYEDDDEIPIECLADNFTLPYMESGSNTYNYYDHDDTHGHVDAFEHDDIYVHHEDDYEPVHEENDNYFDDYQDGEGDTDYQDDTLVDGSENSFHENDMDGFSY